MKIEEEFENTLRNMTDLIINLRPYKGDTFMILLNESPLNMTIELNEIAKIMGEVESYELDSMSTLANMIYEVYKCRMEHSPRDWDSLKEVVHELTNQYYNQNELEKIITRKLPLNLKENCYYKGMGNDDWLNEFKAWAKSHLEISVN